VRTSNCRTDERCEVPHVDFSEIQTQLRKLGRLTANSHIRAGVTSLPHFDGYSNLLEYTGETPIVSKVCEYIEDDLKRLFATTPSQ
jgi:hypothetical protein